MIFISLFLIYFFVFKKCLKMFYWTDFNNFEWFQDLKKIAVYTYVFPFFFWEKFIPVNCSDHTCKLQFDFEIQKKKFKFEKYIQCILYTTVPFCFCAIFLTPGGIGVPQTHTWFKINIASAKCQLKIQEPHISR